MAEDGLAIAIPVLANDSDPDGAIVAATLTIVTGPTNGTITINTTTGEIVYTPNLNFNGVETLVYLICDNDNDCSTATVTITVTPVNDPPVAVDDAATTGEDTPVTISVLLNDFDVDGDPLTLISTTTPAGGIIVVNLDSSLTYTPNPDFSGVDTFTYQISDSLATATATVTITVTPVNDPPIAVDDEATNAEDTSQLIDVLANDINTDGPNPLTIIATSQPANGTVVIEPPRIRYTPNPNFDEVDTFTYTITDGLLTATATVTVTIIPINDAPVAVDDSYSTSVDTPLVVLAPGVLGNDTDVEGSGLTVVLGTIINPANGSLIPFADGSLTYTPNPGFTGVDTFSYQVTDGAATSNFATVTISVP
jgi:hypothetical protein